MSFGVTTVDVMCFHYDYCMDEDFSFLSIRQAVAADVPGLIDIFACARRFMAANGNPTQWGGGYPDAAQVNADVAARHCYVVEHGVMGIVGTFCLVEGDDPTYAVIEDGRWLDDDAYATIHRLASNGACRGVARAAVEWKALPQPAHRHPCRQCSHARFSAQGRIRQVWHNILSRRYAAHSVPASRPWMRGVVSGDDSG